MTNYLERKFIGPIKIQAYLALWHLAGLAFLTH